MLPDLDPRWREHAAMTDVYRDIIDAHAPTALEDDVGTRYRLEPTDQIGEIDWLRLRQVPEVMLGATTFTPSVPEQSRRLTARSPTGTFEIHLRVAT